MSLMQDPRAIYSVVYGCDPDTDELQVELQFESRDTLPGGHICVRTASQGRHEFRYSPPGNTGKTTISSKPRLKLTAPVVVAPADRPCMQVTLVVKH